MWTAGAPDPETTFPACVWPESPVPRVYPLAQELGQWPHLGIFLSLLCVAFHAPRALHLFVAVLGHLSTTVAPLVIVGLRVQAPVAPGCPACSLHPQLRSPLPLLLPSQSQRCQGPGEGPAGPKAGSDPGALRPLSVSPSPLSRPGSPGSCWRWVLCVPDCGWRLCCGDRSMAHAGLVLAERAQ